MCGSAMQCNKLHGHNIITACGYVCTYTVCTLIKHL